jgi:hypothetical protein
MPAPWGAPKARLVGGSWRREQVVGGCPECRGEVPCRGGAPMRSGEARQLLTL